MLAPPGKTGQLSTQPQPVQLLARVGQGAEAAGQVAHAQAIGMGEEGAGHLLGVSMAVGCFLAQNIPRGYQHAPGNGDIGLGFAQPRLQARELALPVGVLGPMGG